MFTLKFIGSDIILIFSSACVFTKYFPVFMYYVSIIHVMKRQLLEKKKKEILQKRIVPIVLSIYQCMYINSTRKFTIYTYKLFRSLLEDLEHQSRWREVDYLDDTAEGDQNFLTPYRLVSLARELCNTGE